MSFDFGLGVLHKMIKVNERYLGRSVAVIFTVAADIIILGFGVLGLIWLAGVAYDETVARVVGVVRAVLTGKGQLLVLAVSLAASIIGLLVSLVILIFIWRLSGHILNFTYRFLSLAIKYQEEVRPKYDLRIVLAVVYLYGALTSGLIAVALPSSYPLPVKIALCGFAVLVMSMIVGALFTKKITGRQR